MSPTPSTSLALIVQKSIQSFLIDGPSLPYNWDRKLRDLIVGICLARSLILQDIAQTRPAHVKTTENLLSKFLSEDKLELRRPRRAVVIAALKRLRRNRIWKYDERAALVIDSTDYAKTRSRGRIRPMPGKGMVRLHNLPGDDVILVPGYQEIWIGILLKDHTVLPLVRRLWTENGPQCASMNLIEEAAILEAQELIHEAFKLDVILIADRGFRRKDLLRWLKNENIGFVIRLEGRLTVALDAAKGLLIDVSRWWSERTKIPWRDGGKKVLVSSVATRRVTVSTTDKEIFCFNVLCLTPVREKIDPMFLATTLTTQHVADLIRIVRLYSWRWAIETFFWEFKQGFNATSWRVFSSWKAIDRLLSAAHMAYLVLIVLAEFARRERKEHLQKFWAWMQTVLRTRFARSLKMTNGRFFRIISMDFPRSRGGAIARDRPAYFKKSPRCACAPRPGAPRGGARAVGGRILV